MSTGDALEFIGRTNKQINRLSGIVNDLLDINRIQDGKLILNKSAYAFDESLLECVNDIKQHRPNANIIVGRVPKVRLVADQTRIEQVAMNLLSNAIKYSPNGEQITVTVKASEKIVKLSICDHGVGIPLEKQPFIFDRFFRVHDTSQHYSGLGMGLFIAAEFVKAHGGTIGVKSREGQGATLVRSAIGITLRAASFPSLRRLQRVIYPHEFSFSSLVCGVILEK